MTDFQNTVMTIATVILVICIIVVGVMIWNERSQVAWPPVVPQCPNDFFLNKAGTQCISKGGTASSTASSTPPLCGQAGKGSVSCTSKAARAALCKASKLGFDYDGAYNNAYMQQQTKSSCSSQ